MIALGSPWTFAVAMGLAVLVTWRIYLSSARGPRSRHRRQRVVVTLLTGCLLSVAAAAAGGLEWRTETAQMATMVLLDRSRSVSEDLTEELREAATQRQVDDPMGLVVFGGEATTVAAPSLSPSMDVSEVQVDRQRSDLAAAIEAGLSSLPPGYVGKLLLVSDGLQTDGDAMAMASLAAARGVTIDVRPVRVPPRAEVSIAQVRVPAEAREEEAITLRVVTRATEATPARIRVFRDGEQIAETETTLREGTDVLTLEDIAGEPGAHRYEAVLSPMDARQDQGAANNRGAALMLVRGAGRALLAASHPETCEGLERLLVAQGVTVDRVEAARIPLDLPSIANYDLIVLHDVPASALTLEQMRALEAYVRDLGGGLWMAGARQSFGLGGYVDTPVERVMPVRFDLRTRRDRLSLAMIIAIDRSGSMGAMVTGGQTKLDLANEAAARSAALLSVGDRVGVMHVDTSPHWTQPMSNVSDPAAIASRVRRATAGGGGIYVDVTFETAFRALRHEHTQLKHLLLFSDGSDSANLGGTRAQVRQAADAGITTSIVSMGRGPHSPELEHLSRLGGGRFYLVEDAQQLPAIFTQETVAASRAALELEPFRPTTGHPSPITAGLDFEEAPVLLGRAVVSPRRRQSVFLWGADDQPLLAVAQHGLGRAAVWATDLGNEFGGPWLRWAGQGTLFDRVMRAVSRPPTSEGTDVSLHLDGARGRVVVEALSADGQPATGMALRGSVSLPSGGSVDVVLSPAGVGRYEGQFPVTEAGPYLVAVEADGERLIGSAGAVRVAGDELRGEGSDLVLLQRIAAATGGRMVERAAASVTERPPPVHTRRSLVPWLLGSALVLLLLLVAARRLSWERAPKSVGGGALGPMSSSLATTATNGGAKASPAEGSRSVASAVASGPAAPAASVDTKAADSGADTPEEAPAPQSLAERLRQSRKKE